MKIPKEIKEFVDQNNISVVAGKKHIKFYWLGKHIGTMSHSNHFRETTIKLLSTMKKQTGYL